MNRRCRVLVVLALVLAGVSAGNEASAERGWIVRVGGGLLETGGSAGGGGFVGVAIPAQPWCLVGLEAGAYQLGRERYVGYYTGGGWSHADPARLFEVSATLRLQVAPESGLAPFLSVQAGMARLRHGDVTGYGGWPPAAYSYTGETENVPGLAIGIGVRAVLPRAWPDVEAGVRLGIWSSRDATTFVEPRIALAFWPRGRLSEALRARGSARAR